MTEMLESPLRLLSYLDLRARFGDRLMATHEHTLLSYHIKYNLWFNDEYDFVHLHDNIAADLDVAMSARRACSPPACRSRRSVIIWDTAVRRQPAPTPR